jgi:lipoprotein-releasing system permease protein
MVGFDGFEGRISWRHLRAGERRRWLLWVGLLGVHVAAVGLVLMLYAAWLRPAGYGDELMPVASDVARLLGLVTLAVGSFAALFAALTALFNLLSAIIVMSVAQGCMALVIVLSLMTGLELDLRSKILAERAELRISRVDGEAFGDYEPLLHALAEQQELAAASPYVEGEVMLRSDFNRQGALLIGVDPALHRRATGIAAMVREGDYRLLEAPADGPWEALDQIFERRRQRVAPTEQAPVTEDVDAAEEAASAEDRAWEEVANGEDEEEGDEAWEDPAIEIPRLRAAGALAGAGPADDAPRAALGGAAPGEAADGATLDEGGPAPLLVPLVIGGELADELSVSFGERLQVITPVGRMTPAGPIPSAMIVRVVGLFHSGMYAHDHRSLYAPLVRVQAFLRLGERVHGVDVRLIDPAGLEQGQAAVQATLDRLGRSDLRVESWRALHRNIFAAMLLEKIAMFIGLLFVVLVAAFGILATNLMSVLDKAEQIAILKAMGASDRSIARIFMLEGLLVGSLGAALGISAGLVVCVLLAEQGLPLSAEDFYIQRLPVVVDPREVAIVGIAALVIVWLSSVHPARTAAQIRPVDGLRGGD